MEEATWGLRPNQKQISEKIGYAHSPNSLLLLLLLLEFLLELILFSEFRLSPSRSETDFADNSQPDVIGIQHALHGGELASFLCFSLWGVG
jgi:hypothetical protein